MSCRASPLAGSLACWLACWPPTRKSVRSLWLKPPLRLGTNKPTRQNRGGCPLHAPRVRTPPLSTADRGEAGYGTSAARWGQVGCESLPHVTTHPSPVGFACFLCSPSHPSPRDPIVMDPILRRRDVDFLAHAQPCPLLLRFLFCRSSVAPSRSQWPRPTPPPQYPASPRAAAATRACVKRVEKSRGTD